MVEPTPDRPEPIENGTVVSAPATVEPSTKATGAPREESVLATPVGNEIVFQRSNSAPSAGVEESANDTVEANNEESTLRTVSVPSIPSTAASVPVPSLDSQPPITTATEPPSATVPPPPKEDDFEGIINSPQGKEPIVERSPGGRYVRFQEKLGSGATKDVYRAYDTQEGIEVAWNVVNLAGVPKPERNRIVNEIRLLERLHHHNIISFHGSWVNREKQEVNFVTEILSSGTLMSFIDKVQVIRWKIAKRWAVQILNGLEYLHGQDPPVIHRDLKCDNIFINGTSGDLRIGDLGLSTVHRQGQVLSVLGTPEFMAPDLYEESAYDERVDIYAFGMCMLEIFTKEIPYRECNNPAQIYKKVLSGIPPESLSRLRSKEARDFIKLCLGHKDEATNTYIRPSAVELLKHPFLAKGIDDESEVEVDPPLSQKTIVEEPTVDNQKSSSGESAADTTDQPNRPGVALSQSQSSMEDTADHFHEMPESEVNIGKVKVMMGRGQQLEENDDQTIQDSIRSVVSVGGSERPVHSPRAGEATGRKDGSNGSQSGAGAAHPHYLVAAAVIEEEPLMVRPYEDDILKLIIRLPVEGQTQNVQFDFHLVEDDPVQVAKEMVAELNIPQDAVLEISETISGLARAARIKQDKYNQRLRLQQQDQVHSQAMPAQQAGLANQQQPLMSQSTSQGVQGSDAVPQHWQQDQGQAPSVPPQQGGLPAQHPPAPQSSSQGIQAVDVAQQRSMSTTHPQQQVVLPASHGLPATDGAQAQQQLAPHLVPPQVDPRLQAAGNIAGQHQPLPGQLPVQQHQQIPQPAAYQMVSQGVPTSSSLPTSPAASGQTSQPQNGWQQPAGGTVEAVQQPILEDSASHASNGACPAHPPQAVEGSVDSNPPSRSSSVSLNQEVAVQENDETGEDEDSDDEAEEDSEEVRKMKEDYEKELRWAQKAFDSRMENLLRSKEEKEAQHLKTLEKHEKEKADFEKRVKQAEKEQNRRLEQLQREWNLKREQLANHSKREQADAQSTPNSPAQTNRQSPPVVAPLPSKTIEKGASSPPEDDTAGALT